MPASRLIGLKVVGFAAAGVSVFELPVRPDLTCASPPPPPAAHSTQASDVLSQSANAAHSQRSMAPVRQHR